MKKLKGIKVWRCLSLAWLLFLCAAYFWPSDALYAITIWPPFVWAGLAFITMLAGIRRQRSLSQIGLLAGWVAFWIVFGEEKSWVPNQLAEPYSSEALGVVTLNCAGGMIEVAGEAISHTPLEPSPAIILLQESPGKKELEKLVATEFGDSGSLLAGPDASIIVRGRLEQISLPRGTSNFVAAIAHVENMEPILIVSLRLQPPVFRLDYWNPECWRAYAGNRANRRQELAEILRFLQNLELEYRWVVIGGDFNSPPDKGTFAQLSQWLRPVTTDSGYTTTNEFPMARIDQIWSNLPSFFSIARRTQNSDHRKVTWSFYAEPKPASERTSAGSAGS